MFVLQLIMGAFPYYMVLVWNERRIEGWKYWYFSRSQIESFWCNLSPTSKWASCRFSQCNWSQMAALYDDYIISCKPKLFIITYECGPRFTLRLTALECGLSVGKKGKFEWHWNTSLESSEALPGRWAFGLSICQENIFANSSLDIRH